MALPHEKGPTQHYIGDGDEPPELTELLQQQQEVLAPPTFYGPMHEHIIHSSPPALQSSVENAGRSERTSLGSAPDQLATINIIARDGGSDELVPEGHTLAGPAGSNDPPASADAWVSFRA